MRLPKKLLNSPPLDNSKVTKGFTLIEMLVVIAIISILIGIGVNTFTIAQKKARDVRRKADLATIQKALIAYGLDHPGKVGGGMGGGSWIQSNVPTGGVWSDWTNNNLVGQGYIKSLPVDPKNTGGDGSNPATAWDNNSGKNYIYIMTNNWPTNNIMCVSTRLENLYDPDTCYSQSLPATPKNPNVDCTSTDAGTVQASSATVSNPTYRICVTN